MSDGDQGGRLNVLLAGVLGLAAWAALLAIAWWLWLLVRWLVGVL